MAKVEKSMITAKPSEPINIAEKEKTESETKVLTASIPDLLQQTEVPATATITAGTWVADIDKANIRKNTLRLGV